MPLARAASTSQKQERVALVGGFRQRRRFGTKEAGSSAVRIELPVFEEATLAVLERRAFGEGPLDSAVSVQAPIVLDARDVAGAPSAETLDDLKYGLRARPLPKQVSTAKCLGDQLKDMKVCQRLARSARHFLDEPDPALGIDEGTFLLAPRCGRQENIRKLCGIGILVHVLDHQAFQATEDLS